MSHPFFSSPEWFFVLMTVFVLVAGFFLACLAEWAARRENKAQRRTRIKTDIAAEIRRELSKPIYVQGHD
jgi:uncharacterized protein involved in cysteine biosynthesis